MGILLIATNQDAPPDAPAKLHFVIDRATVGRGDHVDVTLPSTRNAQAIPHTHARFHWHGTHLAIVDLASQNGTYVNGVRIGGDTPMGGGSIVVTKLSLFDVVRMGEWEIRFGRDDLFPTTDPQETELVESIKRDPHADDVRQVYGDWLEERGRIAEAKLLAIERSMVTIPPSDPRYAALDAERSRYATNLSSIWKSIVSRGSISGCEAPPWEKATCPRTWDLLSTTTPNEQRIRRCTACRKNVYFITKKSEASRRLARGQRVVIDLGINDGD